MRYIISLILTIGVITTLSSCEDIINSDPKLIKLADSTRLDWTDYVSFYFPNENKSYNINDSTQIWEASKPSVWGKPFYIVNNYVDTVILIQNVSFEIGSRFHLDYSGTFPIIIYPGEMSNKNLFGIKFKIESTYTGSYVDKLILNDESSSGIYVRVIINN